jgi:hypothetical protein
MLRWLHNVMWVVAVALAFALVFGLNEWLFSGLSYALGVDWIFLPGGFRLLAVLLLAGKGALGVALASALIAALVLFPEDPVTALGAGALSGFSPWLARRLSVTWLRLREDLSGLTSTDLMKMAALFALLSASLHQLWYVGRGHSDDLLRGIAVMAVGDFLGAVLVLYTARVVLAVAARRVRR